MSKKSDVLQASARILTDFGSMKYSVRQVAKSAGLRVSHVQYYFPTKEDLLIATAQQVCDQAHFRLSRPLRLGRSPHDQAQTIVTEIFESLDTPSGSTAIWELWALAGHHTEIASILAGFYAKLRKVFTHLLGKAQPQLGTGRHESLACCLVALVEGSGAMIAHNRALDSQLVNLRSEIALLVTQIFSPEQSRV